jgi:hypothetical protein
MHSRRSSMQVDAGPSLLRELNAPACLSSNTHTYPWAVRCARSSLSRSHWWLLGHELSFQAKSLGSVGAARSSNRFPHSDGYSLFRAAIGDRQAV